MAEILLSLTIIGVVAAITLPSLTGNINERTWNTQRKALYARMSQAIALMPALNGYGTYTPSSGTEGTDSYVDEVDTVAETFITEGLSKVLKINNICDNEHIWDCGLSSKITTVDANTIDLPTNVLGLNSGMRNFLTDLYNTNAAAFETTNGESILAFYNPNCTGKDVLIPGTNVAGTPGYIIKQQVCANLIYDLNGSKGPNTVGKDIGYMSIIYASDPVVVMPFQPKTINKFAKQTEAGRECALYDKEYRLPNIEEALSLYYNYTLANWSNSAIWSSTRADKDTAWMFGFSNGMKYAVSVESSNGIICVKR